MRFQEIGEAVSICDLGGMHGHDETSFEVFTRRLIQTYEKSNLGKKFILCLTSSQPKVDKYLGMLSFSKESFTSCYGTLINVWYAEASKVLPWKENKSIKIEFERFQKELDAWNEDCIKQGRKHPLFDLRPGDIVYRQGAHLRTSYKVLSVTEDTVRTEGRIDFTHSIESPYFFRKAPE